MQTIKNEVKEPVLVIFTTNKNRKQEIEIAFSERHKAQWMGSFKEYSQHVKNIEEVKTIIQFQTMFDYSPLLSDFEINT